LHGAKPRLIEFSAEASISMENGNIDRNIKVLDVSETLR